jgi:hypothetical protein
MTDPARMPDSEKAKLAAPDHLDPAARLDPVWSPEYGDDSSLIGPPPDVEPRRERLFSRRVLFGWAFATIVVVFVLKMVMPVVFETVKQTIVTSIRERGGEIDGPATPAGLPAPPAAGTAPTPPTAPAAAKPATPAGPAASASKARR